MAKRKTEAFWTQHVAAFEASGASRAAYCRRHALNYWTFDGWRRRLQCRVPAQALVPLMVESAGPVRPAEAIELRVDGRVSVTVPTSVDPVWLGQLLRTVAAC